MSTLTNRVALNYLLHTGINTVFGLEMMEEPENEVMVYEKRTSRKAWEETVMMKGTGYASVFAEDEPISYDSIRNSWNHIVEHEKYGLAARISEEAKDDNLYMQLVPKIGRALSRPTGLAACGTSAAPKVRVTT